MLQGIRPERSVILVLESVLESSFDSTLSRTSLANFSQGWIFELAFEHFADSMDTQLSDYFHAAFSSDSQDLATAVMTAVIGDPTE